MTDHTTLFDKYAELAVRVGLNVRPGQRVMVRGTVQAPDFVHHVTRAAYRAGASLVSVVWEDDLLDLIRLHESAPENLSLPTDWYASAYNSAAEHGDAVLLIHSPDPEIFAGINAEHVLTLKNTRLESIKPFLTIQGRNDTQWSVCRVPTSTWARRVFPDDPAAEQALWNAIFALCRVTESDPVAAWKAHIADLTKRRAALNAKQYRALHFKSPVTDLTLGLPRGHEWHGGDSKTPQGVHFTANLPTEEVFTLPHRDQADGYVSMTRPFGVNGVLIDNFTLTFERGRVTRVSASNGQDVLEKLIASDEGAARLGEVALVSASNPIARSNTIFFDGLFDENAASHIALGRAYRFTLRDSAQMTADEFCAAGGNLSIIHEDTMIGSNELDVDGLCDDNTREPVMRRGEWAFEV